MIINYYKGVLKAAILPGIFFVREIATGEQSGNHGPGLQFYGISYTDTHTNRSFFRPGAC